MSLVMEDVRAWLHLDFTSNNGGSRRGRGTPGEIFCSWNSTWWDCSSWIHRPIAAPGWYRCYRRPSRLDQARRDTTYWSRAMAPNIRRTPELSRRAFWSPATPGENVFNEFNTANEHHSVPDQNSYSKDNCDILLSYDCRLIRALYMYTRLKHIFK